MLSLKLKNMIKIKKDRRGLYTDGGMEDLSLKQSSSLHSKKKYLLLDPDNPPTSDDEKSYLSTFESNDNFC